MDTGETAASSDSDSSEDDDLEEWWVCDVCGKFESLDYETTVLHERQCTLAPPKKKTHTEPYFALT